MRLLILTQKVDRTDSDLGFFCRWIEEFARATDHVMVLCLQKGDDSQLPPNVEVLSLGKEEGASRLSILWRFYTIMWKRRRDYDAVFVHMNPEYVILGGVVWRLMKKKVSLWYTHKAVNLRLCLATCFANVIFTASQESFRLKSGKVQVMGHGIPVERFSNKVEDKGEVGYVRPSEDALWLLSVGRISPAKDWETVVRALVELGKKKIPGRNAIVINFAGKAITDSDKQYQKKLEALAVEIGVDQSKTPFSFNDHYAPEQMPNVYNNSHILVHTSRTGSMDKVVLEALAAGRIVVSSSEAYAALAKHELKDVLFYFPPGDFTALASTIESIALSGILKQLPNERAVAYVRKHHYLPTLIKNITNCLSN